MRALLIILLLALLLFVAGWITFQKTPRNATVTLETDRIQEDVNHAARKGAETLDRAADSLKEQTSELRQKTSQPH
ncbi:MAG: hypothetical protein U0903_01875 [Planctomycetales bacterium]